MSQGNKSGLTSPSVLHEIIRRARVESDHPATKDLDRELSYAQLIDEAARLGAGLRARGVNENDHVAVLIPNSVDFVVTALACLWVGAVFVPLAITDPQSRLEALVTNCAPALVVTSPRDGLVLPSSIANVALVPMELLRNEGQHPGDEIGAESRVAYMIYTSGTTGTPKGVQISTTAFAAAVHSTAQALGLSADTRTLCVSPFHFDGSYANLFPTLISGGTVVMRPRDALLFPRLFFSTVAQEQITYSGFTPSYLRLLLASRQMADLNGSTLDTVAFGGEALSVNDLHSLWSFLPAIRVFNRYGPTEATIAVTNVELTSDLIKGGVIPIGRPHPDVSFVLVDDDGRIVEKAQQTGELYIGGVQLMNGYWADPILTSDVLRSDVIPGEVLYRTGDLVYRDELGNYVYVDRSDRVVKRSGVRISLVELSASMNKVDVVDAAACVIFENQGELGIVAFVVANAECTDLELRRASRMFIPENMMPDRIEHVAKMPLNSSNQLDEAQLLSAAGLRPFRAVSA